MAYANNAGLNELSAFGVPVTSKTSYTSNTSLNTKHSPIMDQKQQHGGSRLTKFGFVMKKSNGDSKSPNNGSSPVSRSKSMKVQRTTAPIIPKVTKHSNSIDNDEELVTSNEGAKSSFLLAPSNQRHIPTKSQPSSRSVTPINDNSVGPFTRSLTVTPSSNSRTKGGGNGHTQMTQQRSSHDNTPPANTTNIKTHTRSSSFSSREKYGISPSATRRTTVHQSSVDHNTRIQPNKTTPIEPSRQFRKSNSKTAGYDDSDGNVESSHFKPTPTSTLRTPDSRRSSLGSQNNGRRPNSLISYGDKSSDLNQLASEINEMGGDTHVFGSTSPRVPSSRSSRLSQGQSKTTAPDGTRNFSKLRPPIARNTSDEGNRPSSAATSYYQHNEPHSSSNSNSTGNSFVSRPRSAADLHKISLANNGPPHPTPVVPSVSVTSGRRSSTPTSGRNTPQRNMHKSIAEEETGQVTNKSISVSATPRRPIGVHSKMSRTPFIRPGKSVSTKPGEETPVIIRGHNDGGTEDAVGLNELEGAVLLDAEDYRRMLLEVKALKSGLLRLKRELAADGSSAVVSPSMSVKSVAKTDHHDRNAELQKEIQKLTSEKKKALADLENSQKKHQVLETKVQSLQKDLNESKQETMDVKHKYNELEGHRESLLEKVERLHADKHKLEDRLNTLEKSVKYESTILSDDWMEYDDTIDNGLDYEDEDATY